MADELYNPGYGRAAKKPRRSVVRWLLDTVMTLLSLVVGVTMIVTYFVPYVNPTTAPPSRS